MRHLFEQQKILEDYWAAGSNGERVLVVSYWTARVRGHDFLFVFRH
jgi:hypothetical protein